MYYRKVIRITAEDSPNVQQRRAVIPGVLTWDEYQYRRAVWDAERQCVGLDAQFWEGPSALLFPPEWLNRAEQIAEDLKGSRLKRLARTVGVDAGEGWANTSLAAVDDLGLVELVSEKTPDTSRIPGMVLAFAHKHGVPAERVFFDRGGGGKQHADYLRSKGHKVQTVAFGESVVLEPKRGLRLLAERKENVEDRYVYKNRRAEMYGELSIRLDPATSEKGFALPREYGELRRQLSVIPRWYDEEGRLYLPPKNKKPTDKDGSDKVTMLELIGCSPDEADAVVLAVWGLTGRGSRSVASAG